LLLSVTGLMFVTCFYLGSFAGWAILLAEL
jgi:hypothetical protein